MGIGFLSLLRKYAEHVAFHAPDSAFSEAHERLPEILKRRGVPAAPAMVMLELVSGLVQTVESDSYAEHESMARRRMEKRDEDDWPVLACALALGCPIWTEDTGFFGCGVATWTTDRVELYLADAAHET